MCPHAPDCNDTPESWTIPPLLPYVPFTSVQQQTQQPSGSQCRPASAAGIHGSSCPAVAEHRPRSRGDRGERRRPQRPGHRRRHRTHDLRRSARRRHPPADGPRPRPPARRLAHDRERRLAQPRRRRCDRDQGTQRHARPATDGPWRQPRRYRRVTEGPGHFELDLSSGTPDPALLPDLGPIIARMSRQSLTSSYLDHPVLPELEAVLTELWPFPPGGDDRRRRGDGRARSRCPVRAAPRRPGRRRASRRSHRCSTCSSSSGAR